MGALPEAIAARIVSAKLAGGVATLVLDVGGLDARARGEIEQAVGDLVGVRPGVNEVRVAMTAEKRARRILAVGSGKGGVGKSTLAANLAIALARGQGDRRGLKVGLVDADIYGPSQPTILGVSGVRPEARGDKLIPVATPAGVPLLSMGQIVAPGKAIAWRGPMAECPPADGAEVYDCKQRLLTPGLIDCHDHSSRCGPQHPDPILAAGSNSCFLINHPIE